MAEEQELQGAGAEAPPPEEGGADHLLDDAAVAATAPAAAAPLKGTEETATAAVDAGEAFFDN